MNEKIKEYWENRAIENTDNIQATTNDIYLRKLEIATIVKTLNELELTEDSEILDVGCGDGFSTINIAKDIQKGKFTGIDYSSNMIQNACKLKQSLDFQKNIEFLTGDSTDLDAILKNKLFDVIMTDRCLINLETLELQKKAISQIAKHVKKGGHYICIENFVEGQENLNIVRKKLELNEIPIRWHNLFFKEDEFTKTVTKEFRIVRWDDFVSSYYYATRIIYSKMCQIEKTEPDYNHIIHKLAVDLPWFGKFSPIRMAILEKI